MSVFMPPDSTDPDSVVDPVIFLAGPIQGAPDWQAVAVQRLIQKALAVVRGPGGPATLHIANPRRPHAKPGEFGAKDYAAQVDWESRWLYRANRHGAILFWLAKEEVHDCGRAYAQTTRFELGEWSGKKGTLAIGIEEGFTGAKYVRHRLYEDVVEVERATRWAGGARREPYVICSTLEDTMELAVRLALQ